MKGSVDKITSEGAIGWLFAESFGRKPTVQAFLGHQLIGRSIAELYRPDLEQVGLGDGRHGFEIGFFDAIDPTHLPYVTIRPEGFDLDLPTDSATAFVDLVTHAIAGYPRAGRNRSVLGGFWTDRTDAPSLLAGRLAAGTIEASQHGPLAALIAQGYVALHGALAPRTLGEAERAALALLATTPRGPGASSGPLSNPSPAEARAAAASLAAFLFTEPLLRLLRPMLDDHPVAWRLDTLTEPQTRFAQACTVEALPSPAESVLLYIVAAPGARIDLAAPGAGVDVAAAGARIDIIRDSHELPEFAALGLSRWTPQGAPAIAELIAAEGASIDTIEPGPTDILAIGPGTAHRVAATPQSPLLRILITPRRVTPTRFLSGEVTWLEGAHISGARVRV